MPKSEAQQILHAVEELYFFRRYDEAVWFMGRVSDGLENGLPEDVRDLLRVYEAKCREKMVARCKG